MSSKDEILTERLDVTPETTLQSLLDCLNGMFIGDEYCEVSVAVEGQAIVFSRVVPRCAACGNAKLGSVSSLGRGPQLCLKARACQERVVAQKAAPGPGNPP